MQSILLPIALMLGAAKLCGEVFERLLKAPAVLAEILVGVLLGVSCLNWVDAKSDTLRQIAEIGSVLLLFEIGLECNLDDLAGVWRESTFLALLGILAPFSLGYFAAVQMGQVPIAALFIGAALTATSIGITARVFSDLKFLQDREAQIVLGAAVADDVIGLVILAVLTALAASGHFSMVDATLTTGKALLFIIAALFLGLKATPTILRWAEQMETRAAVSTAAVVFCLLLAGLAHAANLAPLVGAFAAGIVLAKTDSRVHIERKVRSVGDIFIPLFFVYMGVCADFRALTISTLGIAGTLLLAAVAGKVAAGAVFPQRRVARWVLGLAMVPRGEVGLIFAAAGLAAGVIGKEMYAALVLVVLGTTLVTPPLLKRAIGRHVARTELARPNA